jgi:ribose transport system permease protein
MTTQDAESVAEAPQSLISRLKEFREGIVFGVFILLFLAFWIMRPDVFTKPENQANIMRFMVLYGFLAMGEILVIITGGIDLSGGSMVALTGVLVGLLTVKGIGDFLPPIPWPLALLATLLLSLLIGLWHGFFVTKLGVPPFIITLGTWLMAQGLAAWITKGYPILFPTDSAFLIFQKDIPGLKLPYSFIVLAVVAIIIHFILSYTVLGRHIYATGGNIEAARVSGINVDRVRLFCYAGSGLMSGLTGILLASRLGQGTPTVGSTYELWAICATVIGGTSLFGGAGTVLGAILGTAIIAVMGNGMTLLNMNSYIQTVILGIVLVVAVTTDSWQRRKKR